MQAHPPRVFLTIDEREALKAARRDKKIRIKALARTLDITPGLLDKWQAGTRQPSSAQLTAWWRALA